MNVMIIGTTDSLGGAAKVSWEIKSALESAGHTVSMFVADKRSNDPTIKVIRRSFWRKVLGFLLATENFINTDWLLETPEFKAADIVHCHNLHGRYFNLKTLQKMSLRKPVVWTLHDEWAITPHCAYTLEGTTIKNGLYVCPSLDTPPRLLWDNTTYLTTERNALYQNATLHLVTPCQWLKKRVENTTLKNQDIRLIPNGIDRTIFVKTNQAAARAALHLPMDKKIVLFLATAGKANTWKGWPYTEAVIEHYKQDPDMLFLNVGGFIEESSPTTNVEYRLHVDDPHTLALYYSAADVLLFTSIAENFPLVVLEAMSCGVPIVTFKVGGVTEVVTHQENGYVAAYRNSQELIAGVNWAVSLSTTAKNTLSELSSDKIKSSYTVDQMTNRYLALYQELRTS